MCVSYSEHSCLVCTLNSIRNAESILKFQKLLKNNVLNSDNGFLIPVKVPFYGRKITQ